MPLSAAHEQLLSELHRNLRQDALEPEHPFYVNLRDDRFGVAVGADVVRQLARDVSWVQPPSVAFFSGLRGAGKSTELNRLRNELQDSGFAVAKFDVEHYLDIRFPITAPQLVFAMTGGIWQACRDQGWVGANEDPQSPFRRLWDWFKGVSVESDVKFTAPMPDWSPVDFEAHLRRDPTFRAQLDEFLRARSVELAGKANELLADLDDRVRKHFITQGREWLGMVVIVDSLDHARSETSFSAVRSAIREVFDQQLPLVQFDRFRTVFCIPPYIHPSTGTVRSIFNVKVRDRLGEPYEPGIAALTDLVSRRFPVGLPCNLLLAADDLDELICCSGGHIRDLLRLLDEVILGVDGVPARHADVEAAIIRVRENFMPLSTDQLRWLARIAEKHQLELENQDAWEGLAELLDYHLVLRYSNDEPWYDVHPIVAGVVTQAAADARPGDQ